MRVEKRVGWKPAIQKGEGGEYFAFHPYLPGVTASGKTEAAATKNWSEALGLYLEHCKEFGIEVPLPNHASVKLIFEEVEPESQDKPGVSASSHDLVFA